MTVRYSGQTTTTLAGLQVPLPNVTVYVYDSQGNLATITADGGAPLTNPFESDGQGNFAFNVAATGLFDLVYYVGGKQVFRENGVQIGTGDSALTTFVKNIIATTPLTVTTPSGVTVPTVGALQGIVGAVDGQVASLVEPGSAILAIPGRNGDFDFVKTTTLDLSAKVDNGVYFAGIGGTWVRKLTNPRVLRSSWYDITSSHDEATNTATVSAVLAKWLPGNLDFIFNHSGIVDCKVQIPFQSTTYVSTVRIRGEIPPPPWFGTITGSPAYTMGDEGTILRSTATAGSSITGGIIEAVSAGGWSSIHLVVEDIRLRAYDNPNQHGCIAYRSQQLTMKRVQIETGIWPTAAAQPTHTAYGIRPPTNSNGAWTTLEDVNVIGFRIGIGLSEHTVAQHCSVTACYYGVEIEGDANFAHPIRDCKFNINRCNVGVLVSGSRRGNLTIIFEDANPLLPTANGGIDTPGNTAVGNGWQAPTNHFSDVNSVFKGDVTYAIARGGVGPIPGPILVNGGANTRFRQLGSSHNNYTRIKQAVGQSITNATATLINWAKPDASTAPTIEAAPFLTPVVVTTTSGQPDIVLNTAGTSPSPETGFGQGILSTNIPGGTTLISQTKLSANATASATAVAGQVYSAPVQPVGQGVNQTRAGCFQATTEITFASNSTGYRKVEIFAAGVSVGSKTETAVNGDVTTVRVVSDIVNFSANTFSWSVQVTQNSTGALTVTNAIFEVVQV